MLLCPNIGNLNSQSVVNILTDAFGRGNDIDRVFNRRYQRMQINYLNTPYDDPAWDQPEDQCEIVRYQRNGGRKYTDALLEVKSEYFGNSGFYHEMRNYYNFGLDLPIWLSRTPHDNGAPAPQLKVMIVAQDPQREFHSSQSLFLSSPWGLHSHDYVHASPPAMSVKRVLDGLLEQHDVLFYFTDYVKYYFSSSSQGVRANTLGLNDRIRLVEDAMLANSSLQKVLEREIELVDPDLIITFGRKICDANFWPLTYEPLNFETREVFDRRGLTLYHPNAHDTATRNALVRQGFWPLNNGHYYREAIGGYLQALHR